MGLVQMLTDKVEENPANYHTILEEDTAMYKDVLESLALPSNPPPVPNTGMPATTLKSGKIV